MSRLNSDQRERIIDAVEAAIEQGGYSGTGPTTTGTLVVVGEPNDETIVAINIQAITQYDIDWIESADYGRH